MSRNIKNKPHLEDFTSWLFTLTPNDIDAVIDDLKSVEAGVKFIYIIDPFDIVESYVPNSVADLFTSKSLDFEVNKYLGYEYFFGSSKFENVILLDEYLIELLVIKNHLTKQLRNIQILLKNISELKRELSERFSKDSEITLSASNKQIIENIDLILAITLLEGKKMTAFDEFVNLIKNKLFITDDAIKTIDNSEIIGEIILGSKGDKYSDKVFKKFADRFKYHLLGITGQERFIYLENVYRDIKVIERVISINRQFAAENLKYKAIYLSSAKKSAELIKLFQKIDGEKQNLGAKNSALYRNIFQIFLLGHFDSIASLEKLKEILNDKIHPSLMDKSQSNEDYDTAYKKLNENYRKRLQAIQPNKVYKEYAALFNSLKNTEITEARRKQLEQDLQKAIDDLNKLDLSHNIKAKD